MLASLAWSTAHASRVVIEWHVGARRPDSAAALEPLLRELERLYLPVRPATVRPFIAPLAGRPGARNASLTFAELSRRIQDARKYVDAGDFKHGRDALEAALREAHEHVALLVGDVTKSQAMMLDLLVGVATARLRLRDKAGADEIYEEIVRTFPNHEQQLRRDHGREHGDHYAKAVKRLDAQGAGSLVVTVMHTGAVIFVNEWDRPQNAAFETNLRSGVYRVLVQMPRSAGRVFLVKVEPGKQARLLVDAFDTAVHVTDEWVGFAFQSEQDARARLVEYVRRLVEPAIEEVLAVSRTRWNGRPAIVGSVHAIGGTKPSRSYVLPLDERLDEDRYRAFAAALVSPTIASRATASGKLIEVADPFEPTPAVTTTAAPAPMPAAARRGGRRWPAIGVTTLGATAMGVAAWLIVTSDVDDGTKYEYIDTRRPGYVVAGAGALVLAGGLYWWLRKPSSTSTPTIAVSPGSVHLGWSGHF